MKKITFIILAFMFLSKTINAQWYANSPFRYYVEDGDTIQYIPQVNVKVLLSGCYKSSTSLMDDSLRRKGFLPNVSPYGDGKMVDVGVFSFSGSDDAIVDWVKVTLINSDTTVYLSALLQRDGDVVDMNGSSALYTNVPSGSYKVNIKHRNHLGIELKNSIYLNDSVPTLIDFTNVSTVLYNTQTTQPTRIIGGRRALYAGNCFTSTPRQFITYNSQTNSDKTFLFNKLYVNGVHTPITGYSILDLDMNGTATFISTNNINDRMVIYVNVMGNVSAIIKEQTTF
jgi:hypothetical protein